VRERGRESGLEVKQNMKKKSYPALKPHHDICSYVMGFQLREVGILWKGWCLEKNCGGWMSGAPCQNRFLRMFDIVRVEAYAGTRGSGDLKYSKICFFKNIFSWGRGKKWVCSASHQNRGMTKRMHLNPPPSFLSLNNKYHHNTTCLWKTRIGFALPLTHCGLSIDSLFLFITRGLASAKVFSQYRTVVRGLCTCRYSTDVPESNFNLVIINCKCI
jgi:hypothetical protein